MTTKPHPRERLAAALSAAFRSFSGSSDRELAGEAMRLEPKVLKLVRGLSESKKDRPKRAAGINKTKTRRSQPTPALTA